MHDLLNQLEQFTVRIVENLDQMDYTELAQVVDEREGLVQALKKMEAPVSGIHTHREQIQRILSYDYLILGRMEYFKVEARKAIEKTNLAKKHQNLYEKNYAVESLFYDRKK